MRNGKCYLEEFLRDKRDFKECKPGSFTKINTK